MTKFHSVVDTRESKKPEIGSDGLVKPVFIELNYRKELLYK